MTMNEMTTTIEPVIEKARLRVPPAQRFSGPQHVFDLLPLAEQLLNEVHEATSGHRQMTIFRHEGTTIMLLAFEAGSQLADHKANGLVTMQVLSGAFTVEAQDEDSPVDKAQW